jgi:hypothetical protein
MSGLIILLLFIIVFIVKSDKNKILYNFKVKRAFKRATISKTGHRTVRTKQIITDVPLYNVLPIVLLVLVLMKIKSIKSINPIKTGEIL